MVIDTDKLIADARAAKEAAVAANQAAKDDGSCNLDATVFHLDAGQRAAPVARALSAAGLSSSSIRWLGRGLMIFPPGEGQAGKRYASNQAIFKQLRAAGWPVTPFYQMD